jgi:predicted metal-dependent peptidase
MKYQSATDRKLTRARTQLLLNQPFFGTLCLRLKLVAGELPTMATDGRSILYAPAFVDELTPAELETVLAHEVLHCALGHHCRRGTRDPRLWNEAADLAINPILIANGFTLPAGALLDPTFGDLSAEEIYARLGEQRREESRPAPEQAQQPNMASSPGLGQESREQQSPEPRNGARTPATSTPGVVRNESLFQSPDTGRFGEVWDATDEQGSRASQAENSRQQQEWNIASEQAMRSANSCGREPANLARPLHESRQSKQDWRALLRDFVAATSPCDYRWTPPNRRYIASGLYLPSVERAGVGTIVVAVDTSGSIGEEELEQFAGEITAIADEAKPAAIHIMYCDAAVQSIQQFGPSEPVELEPRGGGGTDFRPVFEWVEANQIAPACLIYLTDLCCRSYPQAPDYPVLWVTDSRRTAPFGETIRIKLK